MLNVSFKTTWSILRYKGYSTECFIGFSLCYVWKKYFSLHIYITTSNRIGFNSINIILGETPLNVNNKVTNFIIYCCKQYILMLVTKKIFKFVLTFVFFLYQEQLSILIFFFIISIYKCKFKAYYLSVCTCMDEGERKKKE